MISNLIKIALKVATCILYKLFYTYEIEHRGNDSIFALIGTILGPLLVFYILFNMSKTIGYKAYKPEAEPEDYSDDDVSISSRNHNMEEDHDASDAESLQPQRQFRSNYFNCNMPNDNNYLDNGGAQYPQRYTDMSDSRSNTIDDGLQFRETPDRMTPEPSQNDSQGANAAARPRRSRRDRARQRAQIDDEGLDANRPNVIRTTRNGVVYGVHPKYYY